VRFCAATAGGKDRQSGPVSRILSPPAGSHGLASPERATRKRAAAISLGRSFPTGSSTLPGAGHEPGRLIAPYLGLLAVGFAVPRLSPGRAVRSYRTVSPLPVKRCRVWAPPTIYIDRSPWLVGAAHPTAASIGGLFSVALSLGSPPVAVSDHRARPVRTFLPRHVRRAASGRLAHSAASIVGTQGPSDQETEGTRR